MWINFINCKDLWLDINSTGKKGGILMIKYILLFIFYLVLDILYAYYIIALTELKAIRPAITSAIIMGMSLFGTVEIIKNHWNAIPLILGCFCGMYISVMLKRLKEDAIEDALNSQSEVYDSVISGATKILSPEVMIANKPSA